jgi:hypothetical protein
MTAATFLQQCLDGVVDPDEIDDFIDAWHEGEGDNEELHQFLGFTEDEYRLWLARPEFIYPILQAHRFGQPLDDAVHDTLELGLAARAPTEAEAMLLVRWLKAKREL